MSKSKKSTPKRSGSKKKASKSSGATAHPRKAKPARVLTLKERSQLLKPRAEFETLIRTALRQWDETPALRVPGVTKAKLASLLKASERAEEKEKKVREKFEKLLAPLADARRVAQDEAYRGLLILHKSAKLLASVDASVGPRFEFITEALRSAKAQPDATLPGAPATPTT